MRIERKNRTWFLLLSTITFAGSLAIASVVQADTYIVTTTADPGVGSCTVSSCSLRDAMVAANANPGFNAIVFAVPGSGVPEIRPLDPRS